MKKWSASLGKGNVNQNGTEIPSHSSQNVSFQENKQQPMLVRLGRRRILIYCWLECEFVQALWKLAWRILKILK
jgi:hypothetical protein